MSEVTLEVRDIHKQFAAVPVLKGVSLEICRGQVKSIIGPSGSGKSTLLRCVNMLEPPDKGDVTLRGQSLRSGNINSHRAQIGFVFQDFNLFLHLTALENVALCLRRVRGMSRKSARDRAAAELRRVGLAGVSGNYPAQLSGGQQQRVAIARALAMDPAIMLFDEATSALDPELTMGVLEVMRELATEGMTMLIVSHEMDFVRSISDEIYLMRKGVIEWHGPPSEMDGKLDYLSGADAKEKMAG